MTTLAQQFTSEWLPIIEPVAKKYGINPEFMLSQIALESQWGTKTPKGSNNYAGIQDFRRNSKGVMANDAGNRRKFRQFDSKEAFAEHMGSLLSRLYPGTKTAKTIDEYTHALQNGKGGRRYAEADTYQTAVGQVYNGQYANGAAYQASKSSPTQQPTGSYAPIQQTAGVGLADTMATMRDYGITPSKTTQVTATYKDPYADLYNIKPTATRQPTSGDPQIATYGKSSKAYNFMDGWDGGNGSRR